MEQLVAKKQFILFLPPIERRCSITIDNKLFPWFLLQNGKNENKNTIKHPSKFRVRRHMSLVIYVPRNMAVCRTRE